MKVYLTANYGNVTSYIQAEDWKEALDKNQLNDDVVVEITKDVLETLNQLFVK